MCILYDKLYLSARKICEHLSISVFMVKKMHRCEQRCYVVARKGGKTEGLVVVTVDPHVVDDFLLVVSGVIILTTAVSASVVAKNHCGY